MRPFHIRRSNSREAGSLAGITFKKTVCIFLSWSLFAFGLPAVAIASDRPSASESTSDHEIEGGFPVPDNRISEEVEKKRIAVPDLRAIGVTNLEAETLSRHIRAELEKTGRITAIGPESMNEILSRGELQTTTTSSSLWARRAGKLLNADEVMIGSLGKVGDSYVIEIRVHAVETGSIRKSVTRAYRGGADGLVIELEKLAGGAAGQNSDGQKLPNVLQSLPPRPPTAVGLATSHVPGGVVPAGISGRSATNLSSRWMRKTGFLVGGSVLSYFLMVGLVSVVSQMANDKPKRQEIGFPPDFPDVPPRPGS